VEKTNNKSIAALTLGILSIILPYIGLVFGIVGLVLSSKSIKEIDNSNENGRGLAISGKVCSIVGISIHALLILLMILSISVFYITETSK
jgi:hypothetical protein